jgi:puromycin-sensitive aminopeptidase
VDRYRLPRTVVPSRYELRLEPDLTSATFSGEVTIAVTVRETTSEIVLNAIELQASDARLENDNGMSQNPTVTADQPTERWRLTFTTPIASGDWRLLLRFRGTLNDKLRGFYRSSYKDTAGKTQVLAATQFEATDARRAFPCWDEPEFKAVFAVTLVVDPSMTAVSNAAAVSERMESGKKLIRFADTIPMSTYLAAFIVGDLEATNPVMVGRTPLRVCCVPGKKHLAAFSQRIGAFSLRYYEDYYGRAYPGDKLDLLAIPDFASGAMENLGAITFRETALLVDEKAATHAELERVADVVAHENAHMWFGDLVTMAWWNGLWLNEAFATFLEMVAVDAFKPEWQRWTSFGVSRAAALVVDGLRSTRPIEYPVEAPSDADAMFDVLTYEKGASVLRMMEQYLGVETFRAGVRDYLHRHAYGNTQTSDLWHALGRASNQPIPEIMDGWVFKSGYPLLSARLDGSALILSQRRFTYLPTESVAEQRWQLPVHLSIRAPGKTESRRFLLQDAEARVELPPGAESVLVNTGGHGFYRVRYSSDLLEGLLRALPDGMEPIERFNLVNDCWAVTLSGLMSLQEYLDLTARFRNERDKNVWAALLNSFLAINRILEPASRPRFEALVCDRAAPCLVDLGWSPSRDEDELTGQLRGDLFRALGILGNAADVQAKAADLLRNPASVDANVLAAVIPVVAHTGDASCFDDFLRRFRSANTPQEEQRYLYALTAFRPTALIEQTLTRTLNGEFRTQDAPYVLRALLMSVHGRELAWGFIKMNWEAMTRTFPPVSLRRMMEGIIGLATPELERDVLQFVEGRRIDLGGKALEQYLEQLRIAVRLRERESASI